MPIPPKFKTRADYERHLTYQREYKIKNREAVKERNRAYYAANREKVYVARKEEILERAKERYWSNPHEYRTRVASSTLKRRREIDDEKMVRLRAAVKNRKEEK